MEPVLKKVEVYVEALGQILRHITCNLEDIEPNTRLIEAAWRYAFNEPKEGRPTMESVDQYHEILDVILMLTQVKVPSGLVVADFEKVQSFEEMVVLHHMLNARLKIDHARLHNGKGKYLTVRDMQLLSGMRESSIRNAISATSGRKLESVLTDEGQRLIEIKDAAPWLEDCRWYRPTDLSSAQTQQFVNMVIDCLGIEEWHEG
jgi:hypothetical protein